jgi:hypothetical protein
MFSNYKLAWLVHGSALYRYLDAYGIAESAITDGESITGDTNAKSFSPSTRTTNCRCGARLERATGGPISAATITGRRVSGSNQMINATAAFAPTDRLTSSFQLNYNSSLTGEIEQQLIGVGAVESAGQPGHAAATRLP